MNSQTSTHHSHRPRLACHECDLLIELPGQLSSKDRLCCPRCGSRITAGYGRPLDYSIAFASTAFIALLLSMNFPFLSFSAGGQESSMTVVQASSALIDKQFPGLALLVYVFTIALPMFYLCALLFLLVPIKFGIRPISPIGTAKLLTKLIPWSMSDVFIVGVLVALIKIVTLAEIIFGFAFWFYIIFAVCFLKVVSIVDSHRLWHWVNEVK